MTTAKNELDRLISLAAHYEEKELSKPSIFHNVEGDCLEVYFNDQPYFGSELGNITVFYSEESKEVVGLVIHNISKFIKD